MSIIEKISFGCFFLVRFDRRDVVVELVLVIIMMIIGIDKNKGFLELGGDKYFNV